MSLIDDGKGRGYSASVSSVNRLNVSAKSNPRSYYISREDGEFYSWYSTYSAADSDIVIYVKNTSQSLSLVISKIMFSGVNAGRYTVMPVNGTASGSDIVGTPFNRSKRKEATAISLGGAAITGITQDGTFGVMRVPAGLTVAGDENNSLIIGPTDAIAVKYEGTAGIIDVAIFGYFEEHSNSAN